MDIDDLLIELAAMRSRQDTLEKNMEAVTQQHQAVTQQHQAVTAELTVARAVIVQMKQREARLEAELEKLRASPPSYRPEAGSRFRFQGKMCSVPRFQRCQTCQFLVPALGHPLANMSHAGSSKFITKCRVLN